MSKMERTGRKQTEQCKAGLSCGSEPTLVLTPTKDRCFKKFTLLSIGKSVKPMS